MHKAIAWFAQNPVAANLLMVVVLITGTTAIPQINKEILPNIGWNIFNVSVSYPGASAKQIEQSVVGKIEAALADIDGISRINTFVRDSYASFSLEMDTFAHEKAAEITETLEERLAGVSGLPEGVEKPKLKQLKIRDPVGNLVIYGDASDRTLKNLGQTIKQDLIGSGLITTIELVNAKSYEITIEVDQLAMQRYGVLFPELAQAIRAKAETLTSGVVDTEDGRVSILTKTPIQTKEDIEDLYVRSYSDGARIKVSDVAQVYDGFSERRDNANKFNGKPAVYLRVFRTGNQSIMDVAEALHEYVAQPTTFIPEGISLAVWQDFARYFTSRVDLLLENATTGLLILCGILLLFLNQRLSFWVGVGIPTAFLGAFAVLLHLGESINMISLFAFILVLGIVVDDAIIVGENIHTRQLKSKTRLEGAILGASEVSAPVVFAVLTTIVMFVPMLFLPGAEGQMVRVIPIVVISILLFSLIESLLILPAHLASGRQASSGQPEGSRRRRGWAWQRKFEAGFRQFTQRQLKTFLKYVLKWRYTSQAFFIGLFFVSLALFFGGWLKMALFSEIEADFSSVDLVMPIGTPAAEVERALNQIEAGAFQLQSEMKESNNPEQIKNIVSSYKSGANGGKVLIELEVNEDREVGGETVNKRWRELVGDIPDAVTLSFDSTLNKRGPNIDIYLTSNKAEDIARAKKELKELLASFEGVYNIREGRSREQQVIHVYAKPIAGDLGINMDEIAAQVRQAFYGLEVMRLNRDSEEVKVHIKYPSDYRGSLWNLENMQILLSTGAVVPLSHIADIQFASGPSAIRRTNGRRSLRVTAYVDETLNSTEKVMRQVKTQFLNDLDMNYTNMEWLPAGIQKTRKQFVYRLAYLYFIALIVMYAIMAVLFKSYFQPLLVMYAVPFGLLGAVLGHLLMDLEVTLWSLIGMCAVSGIVVNDNLVLVDCINRKLKQGAALKEAIIDASVSRFRPIILTTLTTFFGLVPLMLEKSVQAKFLIPMTVSLGFGVVFATLVTLVLVPSTYTILAEIKSNLFGKRQEPLVNSDLGALPDQ